MVLDTSHDTYLILGLPVVISKSRDFEEKASLRVIRTHEVSLG